MSTVLANLQAAVAATLAAEQANSTAIAGAVTALNTLAAEVAAGNAIDPTAIQSIADSLTAGAAGLTAATTTLSTTVAADAPPAPAPAPAPTP